MHRFVFHTAGSFFHMGRGRRDALVEEHGRLDPLIGGIVRDEMRANWWRHLMVSVPLAWCGMWAGWVVSLVLLPMFGWACWRAWRRSQPLLLLYAAPAVTMLGLHAVVANHYTRYNLILIGPYAVAAAWIISAWLQDAWRPARVLVAEE
jgi:4-amino-4-deoxy-L-arabinose transferase-like glycosyltransferase